MGPLRLLVALGVFASSAVLFTQSAPTDLLGPPRTLEGDTDINPPAIDESLDGADSEKNNNKPEEVTTDERYYRIYENGTTEFKTALSNGHVQYQRISNKVVDGKTIQVYEGYVSLRYADGRYGTTYYIADENGYRRTKVEVDTKPPVLPKNGPNPTDSLNSNETEAEGRSPGGSKVLGAEPELSVLPTTDRNLSSETPTTNDDVTSESLIPPTEGNIIKSAEDETLSVLPSTELNLSENETTPAVGSELNGETSTLPTTEGNTETSADDEHTNATPVLPNTDVNKIDEENSTDNEASTVIDGNDDPDTSTQGSVLPTNEVTKTEDDDENSTALPVTDETSLKTTEANSVGVQVDDVEASGAVTTTEENLTSTETSPLLTTGQTVTQSDEDQESTELPITHDNTHKIAEDEQGSGAILPTTEEVVPTVSGENGSSTESSSSISPEDNILLPSTEVPIVEETASKSSEDLATNTELTAIIDDEYLEPITEYSTKTDSQDQITTTAVSPSSDEDIKASTTLPELSTDDIHSESTTKVPALSSTNVSLLPTIEVGSEASTELPVLENDNKSDSTSTEVPALPVTEEVSTKTAEDTTELPALDENKLEASTDSPALPAIEEILTKSEEGGAIQNESSTELPAIDDTYHQASTEVSALPVTEEIVTKANEDGVSQNDAITDFPTVEDNFHAASTEIPAAGETSTKQAEDGVIQNEASTQFPILDAVSANEDKSLEAHTEPAEEIVAKTAEGNTVISEANTELPGDGESLELSTESPALSSSWPALPLVDNVSTELPILANTNVNITKAFEVNGGDLLALENTKGSDEKVIDASTELPTLLQSDQNDSSTDQPLLLNTEEDSTTKAAGDESVETVAKVQEVPITEENGIKTA